MIFSCLTRFLTTLLLTAPLVSQAADVTITINGQVVAKPCIISTKNITVNMTNLYRYNLVTAGTSSEWYDVPLELVNCPTGTSAVTARFDGLADTTGYYQNLGTAKNVQLELQDEKSVTLNTGSTKKVQVDDATRAAKIPLKVRLITVSGNATTGSVQGIINVTYTYS